MYNYKVLINEKGIKESLAEISKISGDTDVLDKVEKYYDEVRNNRRIIFLYKIFKTQNLISKSLTPKVKFKMLWCYSLYNILK